MNEQKVDDWPGTMARLIESGAREVRIAGI
jgi:hypothetical protein